MQKILTALLIILVLVSCSSAEEKFPSKYIDVCSGLLERFAALRTSS